MKHVRTTLVLVLLVSISLLSIPMMFPLETNSNSIRLTDSTELAQAGKIIIFDESHSPGFDNIIADKYSNFSDDLQSLSYTVEAMTTWNVTALMAADVFVTVIPETAYSSDEMLDLHAFVAKGGGLFIISEGSPSFYSDELMEYFGITQMASGVYDYDDYILVTSWIRYTDSWNFGNHEIAIGVSNTTTYYGAGFTSLPAGAVPIQISDADSYSQWGGSLDPARGISTIAAFEYELGLGRVVVAGDANQFDCDDNDGDGTTSYYQGDNDILARNIINWLSSATIPEQILLFDESHSPYNSIGSSQNTIHVVFEETHVPMYSIDSAYADFAAVIEGHGMMVSKMVTWSSSTISSTAEIMVIVDPHLDYTVSEAEDIREFVANGGGLLLISDYSTNDAVRSVARLLGADFHDGIPQDTDEYYTYEYRLLFDEENLANHEIMDGVEEVGFIFGSALNVTPTGAINLVITDNDSSAEWYAEPTGSPSPLNVPVATAFEYGAGRVVITTDASMFSHSGADDYFQYGNNSRFAVNIIRWLGEKAHVGYYWDAAQRLRNAGYGVVGMIDFDETFFNETDALIISVPQDTYTSSERDTLKNYVETTGGGLFLTGEWTSYGAEFEWLTEEFGMIADAGDLYLQDDDDDLNPPTSGRFILETDNFSNHTIMDGIDEVLWLKGNGFKSLPAGANALIRMDDDSFSTWSNGTEAADLSMMAALEFGEGRVISVGDSSLWNRYVLESTLFGDDKTMNIDQLDNELLLMNCIDWLTEVPSTTTPTSTVPPFDIGDIDPIWIIAIAGVLGLVILVGCMKKRSSGSTSTKTKKKTTKKKTKK